MHTTHNYQHIYIFSRHREAAKLAQSCLLS